MYVTFVTMPWSVTGGVDIPKGLSLCGPWGMISNITWFECVCYFVYITNLHTCLCLLLPCLGLSLVEFIYQRGLSLCGPCLFSSQVGGLGVRKVSILYLTNFGEMRMDV